MSIFDESRAYRPFKYPKLVEMAKTHSIDMHWSEAQVELTDDLRQYNSKDGLATKTASHKTNKYIIDSILCLFTELDKTVAGGYCKLLAHVGNNETKNWFLTAGGREVIHQRAYALAAETFGFSGEDWLAFRDYTQMQDKLDIMESRDITSKYDFAVELARVLLGEGIGLFAAFAVLLNYKRFGILIGVNDINQWSLLDENEHVAGNVLILNEVRKELTAEENKKLDKTIDDLRIGYVEAEHKFIDLVFELGAPEDLTKEDLKGYIGYLGEYRGHQVGVWPEWAIRENPIPWIEFMLTGKNHDNFFEKRVTSYSHAGLVGKIDYNIYKELIV